MVWLRGEHILLSKAQRPLSAVVNRPDAFLYILLVRKRRKIEEGRRRVKGREGKGRIKGK
jgi:hypothetical protein